MNPNRFFTVSICALVLFGIYDLTQQYWWAWPAVIAWILANFAYSIAFGKV